MNLLSSLMIREVSTGFENARENKLVGPYTISLHIAEDTHSLVVESLTSIGPNQNDPASGMSLANFVEQFLGIRQSPALGVEDYELGGKMGQTS